MLDFIINPATGDYLIQNGDFVIGESTSQNLFDIMYTNKVDVYGSLPQNTILVQNKNYTVSTLQKNTTLPKDTDYYFSHYGQSIYDVSVMLTGKIDGIVEFALANNINSLNGVLNPQTKFTYSTGKAITDWCFKNDYIFANCTIPVVKPKYITVQYWKDFQGNYWQATLSGQYINVVQASPVVDYIMNQLWIDPIGQKWTVIIDDTGTFVPTEAFSGTPIVSEQWQSGSNILTQTIDINGNFQFN